MDKPERGGKVESYADDLREAFAGFGGQSDDDADDVSPLRPTAAPPKDDPEPDPELDTSEPDGTQESKYGDKETALSVTPELEEREAKARTDAQKVLPPEHWSDEDKAKLASLPDDDARQTVLDWRKSIETGYQQKFDQLAEARKFHEEVGQIMAPFDAELQRAGLTRAAGIKRLVDAERLLRQNPEQGLNWLLGQYGGGQYQVVRKGAQPTAQPGPAEQHKPNGNGHITPEAIQQIVQQGVQQQFQSIREAQERAAAAEAYQAAEKSLREFAEAKGEDGQPKHPHFDAVKVQMGALMQSGTVQTLEDAYEQAVWTVPALREGLTKARQDAAARAVAEAQKAAVAKAKAARTPRTASVAQPPADEDDGLTQADTLRKVWRQHQSGGQRL